MVPTVDSTYLLLRVILFNKSGSAAQKYEIMQGWDR